MAERICFFARVKTPDILDRVEFYAQDLRALRDLGYDVRVATRVHELRPADLYYVWWWTWAFAPVGMARLLGKPVVVGGVLDMAYYRRSPAPHRWLQRLALAGADANVFVSRHEIEHHMRTFRIRNPRYAPLTVDTGLYRPGTGARDPELVFTVGWTEEQNALRKCFPEIVQAAIEVCRARPGVRFVLAGEHGGYYPRLQAMIDEAGMQERIRFPGVFTREEKVAHMQRCALYLQPSRYEGFGMAIAEAMSCGAPVITSPAGEVVHVAGDDALLVDGTRPPEIAAMVMRLLDDPALREEYGRRGRARMEAHFSYERRRDNIGAVVRDALAGRLSAAPTQQGAGPA